MLKRYTHMLLSHKHLNQKEAEEAMNALLETTNPEEIKTFLLALKENGETAEELIGMRKALLKKSEEIKLPYPTLDIVGTGGDLANTFNISTGAAILIAACGIPVTKFGNRSASGRCGSADVLETLNISLDSSPTQIKENLEKAKISFIFAPYYYPCLKELRELRKELKTSTVFNLLGPLLNPLDPPYVLIGVASEKVLELFSEVFLKLGTKTRAFLFYGKGPQNTILDEMTPLGPIIAYDIHQGKKKRLEIDPMKLGFSPCFLEDLKGGDANTNAAILEEVLKGKEGTLHQSAIADTLILNAAAALWIYGKTSSIEAGIPIVRATLEEGKALKTLETWKALSSSKPSRNYLEDILHFKKQEVETRLKELEKNPSHPLHHLLEKGKPCSHLFSKALKQHSLSIIAEVKRHSPSLGKIHEIQDPMALALRYCQGGASAISVLTDPYAFKGSLEDLKVISEMLSKKYPSIPTLRKDFIIHPIQLAEAALAGASAALLIACILKEKLKFFIEEASRLGLETLTEVHDLEDLEYALNAKAPIIGVNHRNLKTFEIDLTLSKELKPLIPSSVITVAESGIHTPAAAEQMHLRGYDAILVGEALVRSEDPSQLLTSMKQKPSIHVKICRVTHPEDAELAAKLGATYIGIIFSKKSKYPISVPQGKEISRAARKGGAIPVAVFVDESLEDILSICKEAQITAVQLHGDPSRKIFSFLPKEFTIFYTIPVHPDGSFENIPDLPKDIYLLFDSSKAGSGHSFDWNHFHPPKDRPFILAGGLNPNNVKQAIDLLHPAIVDVASGVEYPQDRRKDPLLIKSFIHASSKETL